ncbi:hypothetical protein N0V90_007136 [Kalmusia sp. IMI 367209]|nr:hypothetical protein N0V90_007136 [Kalmusia sp. IMI 367209]
MPRPAASYPPMPKRKKIPKDAPVFSEGTKIVGHLNYPPYEAGDDVELAEQHRRFQIYPMGEIQRKGARHIPYNSDKKDFLEKTGREAFEMFQYTFCVPGDEKEYIVVWDYNVGLVRMTPFFKSLKHSKTIPAKALKENSGLKDISYSITGGALVCQGYWMPYQAAKAIAATFCYHIRWALTPVFGNDFPSTCYHPDDPRYGKFVIDPEVVQECIEETNRFKEEGADYKIARPREWTMPFTPQHTPQVQNLPSPWAPKSQPPRQSEESGYCTDDRIGKSNFSPQVSPRSSPWMSVDGSKSPSSSPIVHSPTFDRTIENLPPIRQMLPTSVPLGYYDEQLHAKRNHSNLIRTEYAFREANIHPSVTSTPNVTAYTGYSIREANVPHYVTSNPHMMMNHGSSGLGNGIRSRDDFDAADILVQLSSNDQTLPPPKRTCRGPRY